ncbi:hypothetical protein Fot_35070 [Forsythia ovata]|uniref:Uncharacterized protein n=1 Tax=Forsythia ovata TaxID=205694 RepID=A0ABD1SKH1_9LAMI
MAWRRGKVMMMTALLNELSDNAASCARTGHLEIDTNSLKKKREEIGILGKTPWKWRKVPNHLLTKRDFEEICKLYAYKGDFSFIICSDHLFVKHGLMKKQGSNNLPKIGLADLAVKKFLTVVREKVRQESEEGIGRPKTQVYIRLLSTLSNQSLAPSYVNPWHVADGAEARSEKESTRERAVEVEKGKSRKVCYFLPLSAGEPCPTSKRFLYGRGGLGSFRE